MKILSKMKFILASLLIVFAQFAFIFPQEVHAYSNPAAVSLLTVSNFAALAKSAITNPVAGTVLNNGDMGLDSPATCTGFPSPCTGVTTNGTINNGTIQYQNAVALQGQTDATAVVTNLNGRTANLSITGGLLDGLTLTQGVYDVPATTTNLTGDLTLNGDANSIFIFRASSDFITASTARVLFTGGAQACNVYWTVVSQATFDGATQFAGTVFAGSSVVFSAGGATLAGRVVAQTAAITFRNTTVNNSSCAAAASSTSSSSSSSSSGSSTSTPVCQDFVPTESPNLFQIDRAGSTAVLHFTPVSGKVSYYYVAYGLSPGDERYGVSFPASSSTGAMSFTINDLNPNTTYYFKIRGGYGCAPGGWSNNRESNSKNPSLPNTGFGPHSDYSQYRCLSMR